MSNIIGNRNSTPETSSSSSLRPPRTLGSGHHFRASADMGALPASSLANRGIRPASEVYLNQVSQGASAGNAEDAAEMAAQQWIADIDQYETTLEEMAAATLDQDFKDELSAIEQWFRVLSEPERTAALYALLQQTTQVQIRFFIQVLQQMAKSHPMSGVLSPAAFGEKDAMSSRMSDAMSKLSVEGSRGSLAFGSKPPPSPGARRTSGLDASTIKSMFPDAANAIEDQKAEFQKTTGTAPTSARNSAVGDRVSQYMPTLPGHDEEVKRTGTSNIPAGPWWSTALSENQPPIGRPKSSSSQQPSQAPMGQFGLAQAPPTAGLRAPRPSALFLDHNAGAGLPAPLTPGARWADTPRVDSFSSSAAANQAEVIRNVTATKLGAFTTIENRNLLDSARNFRRSRSQEGRNAAQLQPGLPADMVVLNEPAQYLSPQQVASLQAQRLATIHSGASRPTSPGIAIIGPPPILNGHGMSMTNNGLLTTYDPNMGAYNMNLMPNNLSAYAMAGVTDGYLSDASDINRGRSPRGRRGSSKPPEDPTDPALLQDVPNWLRTLRLHKYTDNLKDMQWQDLVQLDDEGLEKRGVAAKGARTKLLKVFEQVRELHLPSSS